MPRPGRAGQALFFAAAALALASFGCRGPMRPRPVPPAPEPAPEAEAPPEPQAPADRIVAVWAPATADGLLETAEFLDAHPAVRLTAVLPERFFSEDEKSKRAAQTLARLAARRQLEPVLALPGDPPLALIQDTELARPGKGTSPTLPPRFSWPDDVVGHVGQAQSQFRRRWRQELRGMVLPGGVFSGPELALIARLKVQWLLLLDGEGAPGVFSGLPTMLVRPAAVPPQGREGWLRAWKEQRWPAAQAGSAAEAGQTAFLPPVRVYTAADVRALAELAGVPLSTSAAAAGSPWSTVSEAADAPELWPVWADETPPDFSPWIGEPEENLAWRLLGTTRKAVEDYKNSGRADLKNLDLALREIYAAESGRYFLHFGNDVNAPEDADLEREFLAGLAQVFRLMGEPVPAPLLEPLASAPWQAREEDTGASAFFRSQNVLRWTDAAKDDRGPGDYFYPSAPELSPGSWDLVAFEVRAHERNVVFVFEMTALSNAWNRPAGFSGVLVDAYVDINRIPGAGSETLLPGRKGGIVEKRNGWEYALTVDGAGARLFQYSPGAAHKLLATLPVKPAGASAFRVDVPRQHLRGDPDQWGYGVVTMGDEAAAAPAGTPMRVLAEPGPKNFGGAWHDTAQAASGREAPPFIDLLAPPGVSQGQTLGAYKSGRDVVIPFVRAE
jgi:hypothetical protein